jgi:hypothetical protein
MKHKWLCAKNEPPGHMDLVLGADQDCGDHYVCWHDGLEWITQSGSVLTKEVDLWCDLPKIPKRKKGGRYADTNDTDTW